MWKKNSWEIFTTSKRQTTTYTSIHKSLKALQYIYELFVFLTWLKKHKGHFGPIIDFYKS
jgi:hypothetical protein